MKKVSKSQVSKSDPIKKLDERVSNLENVIRQKDMPYINDALEIRPLPTDQKSIRESVMERLAELDYQKVAFLVGADLNSAKIAVMVNLGVGWSFAGFLDKPYHGPLEGGAQIVFTK